MKLSPQEINMVCRGLLSLAHENDWIATAFADCELTESHEQRRTCQKEAEALRELARKISKAQEADDHGVPA